MTKQNMKAYKDVDEWIFAQGLEYHPSGYLLREAWKQAMRTARVQEIILLGEIKQLREEVEDMEGRWNHSWNEEND